MHSVQVLILYRLLIQTMSNFRVPRRLRRHVCSLQKGTETRNKMSRVAKTKRALVNASPLYANAIVVGVT